MDWMRGLLKMRLLPLEERQGRLLEGTKEGEAGRTDGVMEVAVRARDAATVTAGDLTEGTIEAVVAFHRNLHETNKEIKGTTCRVHRETEADLRRAGEGVVIGSNKRQVSARVCASPFPFLLTPSLFPINRDLHRIHREVAGTITDVEKS